MAENDKNIEELRAERVKIVKAILGGVAKFCVGMFFGALAADITGRCGANKVERYSAFAGGLFMGAMVGDDVSGYLDESVDTFIGKYNEFKTAKELGGE